MAGNLKRTTGLTGLIVAKNPHYTLSVLYGKLLRTLQKMPENAAYRLNTEAIVQDRVAMVNAEPDVKALEDKINSGQIEEVIVQAENELLLARQFLDDKPWEPLMEEPEKNQWKWPM
ncbi:unnamed protein product [Cyprideis torosa]|uniref:Uncharacterized protein n=1 Tax=Cyprideis torosa TaxID=163714 RepID=A0A7R8ZJJ2_9CRUS|nr:unnamed protein product [Cyprideis torosa]CAG0887106.1 unnamed protein product [Cyprideis torosa]